MKGLRILCFSVVIFMFAIANANAETKMYLWSSFSTLENSKANEYLTYKARESLFGLGLIHDFNKNIKLEVMGGLGKSDADVNISQSVTYLGKTFNVTKDLEYNTGMYQVEGKITYKLSKNFEVEAGVSESKNALKKDTVMFKLIYKF